MELIEPAFAAAFGSFSSFFTFSAKPSAGIPCSLVYYLRLSQVDSSLLIITSELNVDHFNTEYLVHLGIFQQTVKNEWESRIFKHGSRGSRKHHTVPRLLHTAFQPDAVRHSRYCLPPQRLLLAGRTPAKSSPKLKGVRTTAAITFVTVQNALWIDVSGFVCLFFGFSAVLSCSLLFAAFWSFRAAMPAVFAAL